MLLSDVYGRFENVLIKAGLALTPYVKGFGPDNATVVLIGEAPGKEEIKEGRPFVGKAGKNLDEFLSFSGIRREELFITNVVKIRPMKISGKGTVSNRPPTKEEIRMCASCLKEELDVLSPKCVVTLGNTALKAVLRDDQARIGDCHGKVLNAGEYFVFPLYHPASIIYRRELRSVYYEDLKLLHDVLAEKQLLAD